MIRILDEKTINQIAAGEVIEQAASVVKELIENAIDSEATEIKVETKAGGRRLISISDNGIGMEKDDLLLSVERHATSKIIKIDDLWSLKTLGFRGEALSSITSISKTTIHSSKGIGSGHYLFVEGGKIQDLQERVRGRGTTIEVTSLFYNTPARKNFQKSVAFDTSEIHKVLIHAALCHPEIGFEWVHDDEPQFTIFSGTLPLSCIETLLGSEFASSLISFEEEGASGFIAKPYFNRPNRLGQYLFINGRAVTSPYISKAVLEGYGERLPSHRFPQFVLHLEIPPSEIDVNVHPRKLEVRLQKEEEVRRLLLKGVKRSLEGEFKEIKSAQNPLPPPVAFSLPSAFFRAESPLPPPEPPPIENFDLLFIFGHYLFVKREEALILVIDHLRASRRLFYEKIKNKRDELELQHLLFPFVLERPPSEYRKVEASLERIQKLGISIRPFGKNSFCIDAIPSHMSEEEVRGFLETFDEGFSDERLSLALSNSLRPKNLTPLEAQTLLKALFCCHEMRFCPEGKPIFYEITPKEIAKWLE